MKSATTVSACCEECFKWGSKYGEYAHPCNNPDCKCHTPTNSPEPTVEKWDTSAKPDQAVVMITNSIFNTIDWEKHYTVKERQALNDVVDEIVAHSVQEARAEERERILSDFACIGATIPKYNSQGWTHWIDEYIRKNGLDPVAIRGKYLSTLNTKEEK